MKSITLSEAHKIGCEVYKELHDKYRSEKNLRDKAVAEFLKAAANTRLLTAKTVLADINAVK